MTESDNKLDGAEDLRCAVREGHTLDNVTSFAVEVGDDEVVFLEVKGGCDKLVEPDELIDLGQPGVERFFTGPKPNPNIEIIVNSRPKVVPANKVTFEQIVELAFVGQGGPGIEFSMTYRCAATNPVVLDRRDGVPPKSSSQDHARFRVSCDVPLAALSRVILDRAHGFILHSLRTMNFGQIVTVVLIASLCVITAPIVASADETKFDVNDVSFLWPVPKNQADVDRLISADEKVVGGSGAVWPSDVFTTVIKQAGQVVVTNSAGRQNKIDFQPFNAEFAKASTWKIVSFRVDPSAAGTNPDFIRAFGEIPQVRLVLQPVTVAANGTLRIHDVTVHLVFSFVKPRTTPSSGEGRPVAIPDRDAFRAIVDDLKALKFGLEQNAISTGGKLTVHPGFQKDVDGFTAKVRSCLLKHLNGDKLTAVAFMGIDPPEPWIFFAMRKTGNDFKLQPFPVLGGNSAQMLILVGGTPVIPTPVTTNVDAARGVHTSVLFSRTAKNQLKTPVFNDIPNLKFQDIPDLIANPTRSHFFNTDCVSCHSESSRRKVLGLGGIDSEFQYRRPDGISSVDETLLPKDQWNVRNFGWFPAGASGGLATVTMRTANEAAESADFVNHNYLNGGAVPASQK